MSTKSQHAKNKQLFPRENTQWQIYWLGGYGGGEQTKKCAISKKFSTMWIKKHLWTHKCATSFLFFSCMNAKNHLRPLVGSQVWSINFFFNYVNFKNHLWAHKCVLSFLFSLVWVEKPLANSQMCNNIFFLQLCEFFKSLTMGPQVCNVISFFFCLSAKNHSQVHKCVILIFFFNYVN
jgi:hypothetical protein